MAVTDAIRYAFVTNAVTPKGAIARERAFTAWLRSVQADAWEQGVADVRGFYAGGPAPTNPFEED